MSKLLLEVFVFHHQCSTAPRYKKQQQPYINRKDKEVQKKGLGMSRENTNFMLWEQKFHFFPMKNANVIKTLYFYMMP